MSNNSSNPFFMLAVVISAVFSALKLAEVGACADWSWLVVSSPVLLYFAVQIGFVLVLLGLAGITAVLGMITEGIASKSRLRRELKELEGA